MLVKFAVEVQGVDPREEEVVGEVEVGGAPSLAPVAEAVEEVEVVFKQSATPCFLRHGSKSIAYIVNAGSLTHCEAQYFLFSTTSSLVHQLQFVRETTSLRDTY